MLNAIAAIIRFPFFVLGLSIWTILWPLFYVRALIILPFRFIGAAFQNDLGHFIYQTSEDLSGAWISKGYRGLFRWEQGKGPE
jgi:hypothetical protein